MRLIDAAALTDVVWKSRYENPHSEGRARMAHHNEHSRFLAMIDHAPTIEARPVVRGEWIEKPHTDGFGGHYFLYHCSRCDTPYAKKRNFCNECGADMRTKEGE